MTDANNTVSSKIKILKMVEFYLENKSKVGFVSSKIILKAIQDLSKEEVVRLSFNDGNVFWDRIVGLGYSVTEANELTDKKIEYFNEVLTIVCAELLEIRGEHEASENVIDAHMNFLLKNNNNDTKNSFIHRYKNKHKYLLRKQRERFELQKDIKRHIDMTLEHYDSKQRELKDNIDYLDKNVRAIQGKTSFSSALAGFKRLERYTQLRLKSSKEYMFYSAVSVVVALVVIFSIVSISVFYGENGGGGFLDQIVLNDIKLFFISSTVLFVLLYFFRVSRLEVKYYEDKLSSIEMKSAITAFQKGHVDVVKESGGDVNESLKRYEEYILENSMVEKKDAELTDNMKDIADIVEKLLKAKGR